MSPVYMGTEIGDPLLQNLVRAFRDGARSVGAAADQGDDVIIKLLEENKVTVAGNAPTAFELGKNQPHVEAR